MKPIGSQAAATVLVIVGWLVFRLLFYAFFAHGLNTWQTNAVNYASMLVAGGIVAAAWIKWAIK